MTQPEAQPASPATAPPGVTRCQPRPAEAIQLTSDADWDAIADWCHGIACPETDWEGRHISVPHVDGDPVFAEAGDWIVRDAEDGQVFVVFDAHEFVALYEVAGEVAPRWGMMLADEVRDGDRAEPRRLADPEPVAAPFPPGTYGRAELPGFRSHVGWATDGVIGGQPCIVMSDRDGTVLAEYILGPASRFVRLAVPDPVVPGPRQEAITQDGTWYDDGWPDNDDETNPF